MGHNRKPHDIVRRRGLATVLALGLLAGACADGDSSTEDVERLPTPATDAAPISPATTSGAAPTAPPAGG